MGIEIFRAQRDRIRMVLLDMTMPHLNGEETFRALRAMKPDLPVLFSSGYTRVPDMAEGERTTDFLQKPFRVDELRRKLRILLEASG